MVALIASLALAQSIDGNIVYTKVKGKELKLDAYRPAQPSGRVFIAIHGGGFTGGSKGGDTGVICSYLMKRGFTCFDIDYRLQGDVGGKRQDAMTAAIDDTIAAYNWVVKNAKTYGGDPNKISIGGSSAGAITALYVAYSRRVAVRSVVDLWGGMYGKESDIRKGDAPLLIVHGKRDNVVPYHLALDLANRAKIAGLRYRFLSADGGHGLNLNGEIDHYTILAHIESFLRETM